MSKFQSIKTELLPPQMHPGTARVQDHIHLSADLGEPLYGVAFLWPRRPSLWVYRHEKGSVAVLTSWLTWLMFASCWCDTSTRAGFCKTKTSDCRASEQLSSCFSFFRGPGERSDLLMYKSDPSWSSWFWRPMAPPYQSSPGSCIVHVPHKLIVLKLIKF